VTSTTSDIRPDGAAIDYVMNQASRRAIWESKQLGFPICVWRDGKVVWIPPHEIEVDPPDDVKARLAENQLMVTQDPAK